MGPELFRNLGVSVARQVGDAALLIDVEEDDLLCPPRCLAGSGEGFLSGQGVDRAGLSCVGAAGKGHFVTAVRSKLP